jgi:release factor glutamine methyltransferase
MKLREFALSGKSKIEGSGIQCADPLLHMKQILEVALEADAAAIYKKWEDELSPHSLQRAESILNRRLAGEPFQYIIGYEWFWKYKYSVGPGVLIPRKETELLVEILLEQKTEKVRAAELGGGSGNIGISIIMERPSWEWHAFEVNPESVSYFKKNAALILPKDRQSQCLLHEGDFFELAKNKGFYDWVVANPPYLSPEDMGKIPIEVSHEPKLALEGGPEGLSVIEKLLAQGSELLKPGGQFLFEIGMGQSDKVNRLLQKHGFSLIGIREDYAGIPRVVHGVYKFGA